MNEKFAAFALPDSTQDQLIQATDFMARSFFKSENGNLVQRLKDEKYDMYMYEFMTE